MERAGRADVMALPSTVPEGQPLAILEGMAAGCAILTTAQGSIVDTVGDAEGAVLGSLEGGTSRGGDQAGVAPVE